ncbi:MAG: 2-C-methyl-D-erythritol 4-phosphate cytidylyltransferase [Exiguobacterium sp.]|uniref:2-C-methyl-D-erythritol 4-phosphate cytidylyltransferase n=1 Tax=Exiguobacterium alkaliphilum TaxID=1428684 RepID=A0ABT2KW50_9BACL|nr:MULTISPECIES: 2-C-methyl-D-erythritol 4-phosphate cytidylyltransferase [Exiguobacterium]MDX5322562.1 2-C-methyl-D-erythritol 4-phosphate cytidylyltransferase [Exiguobacterium sp.]MCT4794753.1 2-C-methyl-D-erythritol 4-phosphate cytidylyltransferase [Exiguobacterium alkaliphilum]MDX5424288.1 2-C-methyl-D-erythritol 4-phosphate cytidylyltransferase [Exiguobacterium sp.]MDX6771807.1 2-C-methyl-D-erythritol 4-phosphate cytidylyltransferase [Exiguobacterium sp.]QUE86749.1 2-C-methyl-D-erythritol
MRYAVVIPAAGQGKRMGANENKLMLQLQGKPIIVWTVEAFARDTWCDAIILAIRPEEEPWFRSMLNHIPTPITYVTGGKERQESVRAGLHAVTRDGVVLIHDGARPFIRVEQLRQVAQAGQTGGAILAVPVKDTVKQVDAGQITRTVPRETLWLAQTPQAFPIERIRRIHDEAAAQTFTGTDDASLFEWAGHEVAVIPGDYHNIKITTPEDLLFGEAILTKEDYR